MRKGCGLGPAQRETKNNSTKGGETKQRMKETKARENRCFVEKVPLIHSHRFPYYRRATKTDQAAGRLLPCF